MFCRALLSTSKSAAIKKVFPFRNASKLASSSHLYKFTEKEKAVKENAKKFANDIVKPKVVKMDQTSQLDDTVKSAMFDNGLMAIETPAKFGGCDAGFFASILAIEEVGKIDPTVSGLFSLQNALINTTFLKWASDGQRKRYCPKLAKDTAGCICISEASAGSDAFSMKTVATKPSQDADHFILNGSKIFASHSEHSGILLVFANAKPEDGHRGITCFIVERDLPGISIGKNPDKLGIRALSTCPVHFNNVKVPAENVLGEFGKGYKYAMEMLNEGRIGIGAQMVGLAQGAFDLAVGYARKRKQFGKSILDFQAIQHQMADVAMKIEAARLLVYNAARMKQVAEETGDFSGKSYIYQASMAKLYSSEIAQMAASRAIDWMGGLGLLKATSDDAGPTVEKMFRDAKVGTIYEGTSNIQLNTIAKFIIDGKICG